MRENLIREREELHLELHGSSAEERIEALEQKDLRREAELEFAKAEASRLKEELKDTVNKLFQTRSKESRNLRRADRQHGSREGGDPEIDFESGRGDEDLADRQHGVGGGYLDPLDMDFEKRWTDAEKEIRVRVRG